MSAHLLRKNVIEALWPPGLSLRTDSWVILDAARDQRIFGAVDRTSQDKCCLYSGDLPWQLQMAAPYLVRLDRDDWFTDYVIDNGWGNSWGVFFRSETSMRNLRNHLRKFLRVRDEEGRRLIFRYYDPRVLRVYLPTCREREIARFFGPIQEFLIEYEGLSGLVQFSFDGQEIKTSSLNWIDEGSRTGQVGQSPPSSSLDMDRVTPGDSLNSTMTVRQDQIRRFEQMGFDSFVARLIQYLMKFHAGARVRLPRRDPVMFANLCPLDMEMLVRYGVERARSYRFTSESTITAFVAVLLEIAPNLDSTPVMEAILKAPIDEHQKIRALCEIPGRAQWEEAAKNYDPDALRRLAS